MPEADPMARPARRFGRTTKHRLAVVIAIVGLGLLALPDLAVADAPAAARPVGAGPAAVTLRTQADDGPQLPGPRSDPGRAGQEARRILDGDEYKQRSRERTVIERIRDWIKDHLPKRRPSGAERSVPRGISFVIVGLILAAAIAALAGGLVNTRRARRHRRGDDESDQVGGEIEVTPLLSVDEWREQALRLEAEGRWREALRAQYRSLVGALIDGAILGDPPGRTPGEYRVELERAVPDAAVPFAGATAMFEAAWYGHRETSEPDLRRFDELAEQVRSEARPAFSSRRPASGTPVPDPQDVGVGGGR